MPGVQTGGPQLVVLSERHLGELEMPAEVQRASGLATIRRLIRTAACPNSTQSMRSSYVGLFGQLTAIQTAKLEGNMRETRLTVPQVALIAGTRGMLGAGIALLLADKLNQNERRAVGWTLFLVGAITTVPLVVEVLSRREQ
jgi:hypothetical protein